MNAPEPTWMPVYGSREPHEGSFARRPAVKGTLRALNLIGGFAGALAAFVVVGFLAAVMGCVGEETQGLCVHHADLVPVLEWPIFVISVIAPLAGGIAAFVTRGPRWLALGVGIGVLMFAAMIEVSTGQSGLLG